MGKWADYLISAVRYEEKAKTKHISKLEVHIDKGDSLGPAEIWTRQDIVNSIDASKTFKTIYKEGDSSWKKGEDVRKIKIDDEYYLRTDANKIKEDNLGELPEF